MNTKTIVAILLIFIITGCSTLLNPLVNKDKFEDYVPWWANTNSCITNTVIIVTNAPPRIEVDH